MGLNVFNYKSFHHPGPPQPPFFLPDLINIIAKIMNNKIAPIAINVDAVIESPNTVNKTACSCNLPSFFAF
jgi:hypothetical protein